MCWWGNGSPLGGSSCQSGIIQGQQTEPQQASCKHAFVLQSLTAYRLRITQASCQASRVQGLTGRHITAHHTSWLPGRVACMSAEVGPCSDVCFALEVAAAQDLLICLPATGWPAAVHSLR